MPGTNYSSSRGATQSRLSKHGSKFTPACKTDACTTKLTYTISKARFLFHSLIGCPPDMGAWGPCNLCPTSAHY